MLTEWKRRYAAVVSTTADALILRGPVLIHRIRMTASGGAGTVVAYDGVDTGGTVVDALSAADTYADESRHSPALFVRSGLYLDVTNVGYVVVDYSTELSDD